MLIFEWEFHNEEIAEMIENTEYGREVLVDDYAKKLAEKVVANIEVIDGKIDQFSTKWKRRRIAKVSLAVLRTALGELMYFKEVPTSVVINEAVEITKRFATEADASYINGVLGGAARAMEAAAKTEA
jgi:N utilization substance protein B